MRSSYAALKKILRVFQNFCAYQRCPAAKHTISDDHTLSLNEIDSDRPKIGRLASEEQYNFACRKISESKVSHTACTSSPAICCENYKNIGNTLMLWFNYYIERFSKHQGIINLRFL